LGVFSGRVGTRRATEDRAGFGLIGDLIIGIIGAFIGSWLLPKLGIHLGHGIVNAIVNATIGAVLLLLIIRLRTQAVDADFKPADSTRRLFL
jgi:uncharacterized membrane protein YeaQ/YmgE (transglycosylase-associated protein family)